MRQQALRAALAALAGMVGLVLWGMLFWGLLADPLGVFRRLPNDAAVTQLLEAGETPTGTYFMPWPRATPEQFAAFVAQHQAGPFYRLSYVREGIDPNSPGKLILGCLHYLAVATIAVGLVLVSRTASFGRRLALVTLGGLLGTLFITLGDPIWFHLPWDYTLGVLLYELVAWALLGSIVARLAPRARG
jgi:hypothetical protein